MRFPNKGIDVFLAVDIISEINNRPVKIMNKVLDNVYGKSRFNKSDDQDKNVIDPFIYSKEVQDIFLSKRKSIDDSSDDETERSEENSVRSEEVGGSTENEETEVENEDEEMIKNDETLWKALGVIDRMEEYGFKRTNFQAFGDMLRIKFNSSRFKKSLTVEIYCSRGTVKIIKDDLPKNVKLKEHTFENFLEKMQNELEKMSTKRKTRD